MRPRSILPILGTLLLAGMAMADPRPNVIVILTDDQGIGQLDFGSAVGNPPVTQRYACDAGKAREAARVAMPHVSRLAGQGVRFTEAHVASPICGPSRAAFITGRYPQRFGVYSNMDIHQGVPTSETFLPELMQQAGYRTAMIGKWHLGRIEHTPLPVKTRDYHKNSIAGCAPEHHPLVRGFDYYFGFNASGANYYGSPSIFRNHENVPVGGYLTEAFSREAASFIRESGDDPFFIYLAYNAPHIPLDRMAPEKYLRRFDTGNREVDNYYATIAAVDDGIGSLFQTLEDCGQDQNTLIFFLSDNGAVIDSPHPANGVFSGNKGQLFQGGTHIPMVLYWGGGTFEEGQTRNELVSAMDVLPTSLAAANIPVPESLKLDGINLLPMLRNEENAPSHEALCWAGPRALHWGKENTGFWRNYDAYIKGTRESRPYSQHTEKYSKASWAVRQGPWSLHYWAKDGSLSLFNVRADSAEQTDVAAENPDIVAEMKQVHQDWIAPMPPPSRWKK